MAETPLIKLDNVSLAYNGEPILDDISLEVGAGEYVGVIGPNGGGKTTLLRSILGLVRPSAGEVHLFGQPVSEFREWWRVGYVPQSAANVDRHFPITVDEVVSLGRVARRGLWRRLGAADRTAVTRALDQVDMTAYRHRLVHELSGGQRQRVLIAKALAAEPQLLLLDEPAIGIDAKSQDAFYQLVSSLNRESGLTLVMVSHDIDVVVSEVTKIACINETLIYHGHPQDFVKGNYMTQLYGKKRKLVVHEP